MTSISSIGYGQTCNEKWRIAMSSHTITPGQSVVFTYSGAANNGATLVLDFGDGTSQSVVLTTSPTAFPAHTYSTAGIYNITAQLSGTCVQTKSAQIAVNSGSCSGSIGLTNHNRVCKDESATYEIEVPNQSGWSLVNYTWNMGDGTFISSSYPSLNYIYNNAGYYYRTVSVHLFNSSLNEHCYYLVHIDPPVGLNYFFFETYVAYGGADFTMSPTNPQPGDNVVFTYTGTTSLPPVPELWAYSFSVGAYSTPPNTYSPVTGSVLYTYSNIGVGSYCADFSIALRSLSDGICPQSSQICFNVSEIPCDTCNSFKPKVGERYWISAWVKVDEPFQVKSYNPLNLANSQNVSSTTLDDAYLELEFLGPGTTVQIFPTDEIIDGWQRIVGEFTIPLNTYDLAVNLYADDDEMTFFDDIRIHPFNASMKSYVYDGDTFWLVSELDDNNYATFYEYDQEGGLIRIKKETARGIVTIQETRSNTTKVNP